MTMNRMILLPIHVRALPTTFYILTILLPGHIAPYGIGFSSYVRTSKPRPTSYLAFFSNCIIPLYIDIAILRILVYSNPTDCQLDFAPGVDYSVWSTAAAEVWLRKVTSKVLRIECRPLSNIRINPSL